jgi:lipoprotein NlpI
MRAAFFTVIFTIALLAMVGCSAEESAMTETQAELAVDITPEELGELGAKIRQDPSRAEQLLAERGLTDESYEQAIREVSEDGDSARRYADALEAVEGTTPGL